MAAEAGLESEGKPASAPAEQEGDGGKGGQTSVSTKPERKEGDDVRARGVDEWSEEGGGLVEGGGEGEGEGVARGANGISSAKSSNAGLAKRGKRKGGGKRAEDEKDENNDSLKDEDEARAKPAATSQRTSDGEAAREGPARATPFPEGSEGSGGEAAASGAFAFWFYLVTAVAVVTGAAVLVSGAFFADGRAEWARMPPLVREHYSRGQTIKVPAGGGGRGQSGWVKVFVRSSGPAGGEVVVCVHGTAGSSFLFREVLPRLHRQGLRAIAIDLPGAGLSDKPPMGIYDTYQLARSLGAVLASLALPPVHLVMHDTGGLVGTTWAAQNVANVRSLTFIDTPMEAPFAPAVPSWLLAVPSVASAAASAVWPLRLILRAFCSRQVSPQAAEAHAYLLRCNGGLRAALLTLQATNRSQAFAERLYEDAERALGRTERQFLWASSWSRAWEEEGQVAASHWPLAVVHSHRGGRWPLEDVPEEIADKIAAFVLSLPLTKWSPPKEEIPEHIQRQFDAMKSHGHSHSHGAGCGHKH